MGVRTDFVAKATINRHDFGLGQGVTVRFAANSLINIEIDLEAVQQSVEVHETVIAIEYQKEQRLCYIML